MSPFDREHSMMRSGIALLSGPEGRALLAHLRECGECAGEFAKVQDALLAELYLPPPRAMGPVRAVEVRERLLARSRSTDSGAEQGARRMPNAAGLWTVAAGLATLLLTHHAFHRPLRLAPLAAAALAVALFGAVLFLMAERRRSAVLRERLAALDAELARIRRHALATGPMTGSA